MEKLATVIEQPLEKEGSLTLEKSEKGIRVQVNNLSFLIIYNKIVILAVVIKSYSMVQSHPFLGEYQPFYGWYKRVIGNQIG